MTEFQNLGYEEHLKAIKSITKSLQEGTLDFTTSIEAFENGMRHIQACEAFLAQAELKIEQVEEAENGTLHTKPFNRTE